ncbi:MAG: BMP family ABC transporter substrate-binding protein [Devosiaceae bacterium]|nr:BMP family ABC transporter substrate-binding protein [Devosiaceae bacterium MH13]
MKRVLSSLLAVGTVAALSVGFSATTLADDEPLKVGFVYVGPISDHGWSYAHDQARLAMEAEFGDMVETTYLESVPEGADTVRALERMARSGHDIIFATSFGYMESVGEVAERFPDVVFEHATGYQSAGNFANYNGHFYEGRYVLGKIAGLETETNTIGYIASYAIPEVVSGINAFMLGAQSVNPDVEVKIIWVNTWYDPPREAEAANALIDQGADILVQHTDSTAQLQASQERGVRGFGNDSDMGAFAPEAQLTAIVNNWAPYYIDRVQAVMDGTWETGSYMGNMEDGMVQMAPFANMADETKAVAEETMAGIISGDIHPFTGPIFNQAGEEVVAAGEVAPLDMILSMNFYIQGIDDAYPN